MYQPPSQPWPGSRRGFLRRMLAGAAALTALDTRAHAADANLAAIDPKDHIEITKLEMIPVHRTRSVFLKVHTDAGIVGLGEPSLEGWSPTVMEAVREMEPYLLGKDPRQPVHHWQALYRHAFYRGGPVLTSALSGIDMALWDIKGKALGVPVYELLGGPTRDRIRVYAHAGSPEAIATAKARGFTAFKTGPAKERPARIVENPAFIQHAAERFAALREAAGPDMDIAIDLHGAIPPQTSKLLIKALEPYQPMFVEEPVQYQNLDVMAEIARGTRLPIATGERISTKWGFREVLEKQAASILQPDVCHVGGITEMKIVAGMAEAWYVGLAPHGAEGIVSTAAAMQVMAAIPNFLILEQVTLGEGYIKAPFQVENGHVPLPTAPGLGIELDDEALAGLDDPDWNFPTPFDADDGSVRDW
jgi:galactonate dehydratase